MQEGGGVQSLILQESFVLSYDVTLDLLMSPLI